jgi:uncharacterized protein YuzE
MRATFDPYADATYIALTDMPLEPGRHSIEGPVPAGTGGQVILDWRNGHLVGIEIVGAVACLPSDLLADAERLGEPQDWTPGR